MDSRTYLAIIALLLASPLTVFAQQYAPPSPTINMSPIMDVLVYPDGSIRVLYNLSVVVENIGSNATGFISLDYVAKEVENHSWLLISGGGELGPVKPGTVKSTTMLSITSYFKATPIDKGYNISGRFLLRIENTSGNEKNYTIVNVTGIDITIRDKIIELEFNALAEGNISVPEEYVGKDSSAILNMMLLAHNITWIRFEELYIVEKGNTYYINGSLTASIDELVEKGLELRLISRAEAREIDACINSYYRNVTSTLKFATTIYAENYVEETPHIVFKLELESDTVGEVKEINDVSRKCGNILGKLAMTAILISQPQQPGQPMIPPTMFMPETRPPNLKPVYPYTSKARIRARFGDDKVVFNLTVDSGRLTYVEDTGNPVTQAKISLREISTWLQQLDKQLSILALMGIPSPIPSTINVRGERLADKIVVVEPDKVTLQSLPEIKIRVGEASATTTPITTNTSTPSTRTTHVTTLTVTETETTTTTMEITRTVKETVTQTITTTVRVEETGFPIMLAIALSVATVVVVIALALLVLKTLRK